MEFARAYREMEKEFAEEVARANAKFGWNGIFVPNVEPVGPVDFVLVGEQPSRGQLPSNYQEAIKAINDGHRTNIGCWQCDPVHYSVDQFLCEKTGSYYLTNFEKSARLASVPSHALSGSERGENDERWYSLLVKELALVANTGARIIALGSRVDDLFRKERQPGHVGRVLDFQRPGPTPIPVVSESYPVPFEDFRQTVEFLPNGKQISESRKELMFHYKVCFEKFRVADSKLDLSEVRILHWGEIAGAERPLRQKGCDCEPR